MAVYAVVNSFNAGELSPKMIGRSDVSQYSKGCLELLNFLVTPYGACERRPGTVFVASTKNNSRNVRLIPFKVSSDVSYVCEFGDLYIRFYLDDEMVDEIVSPYSAADLADLKYIESADVMFICHSSHPVYQLKRIAQNEFTISEMEFEYPPVLDPNLDDDLTITPSGRTGDITLTATKDIFADGNIGGFWQLVHVRKSNEIANDFTADGVSFAIEVFGYWTLTTHGTWTGNLKIQRSFDGGTTWTDYRAYSSAKDSNVSTSGEEKTEEAMYRLQMSGYEASTTGTLKLCRVSFINPDYATTGIVRITGVTDARHAVGTVIKKLGATDATKEWNEGAWSIRRGFPRAIAFYEERLMVAGTSHRPQTVWGSKVNDWDNFLIGSNDDSGLDFTLSSDSVNTIEWMCQHDALIIGTVDSEWTLSASSADSSLTPTNIRIKRQSVYGSGRIPACMVGDVVLFVQRNHRKIREFVYEFQKDGYIAPDLTILAEHVTASGIREIALQQQPDTILWCVLNNGTIAAMTYERDQEVVGWSRHVTSGSAVSVTVIPCGGEDVIYFAVERANGVFIERMGNRQTDRLEDSIFTDSAVSFSGAGLTVLTGLDHLEGAAVQLFCDGSDGGDAVVSSGSVTLKAPADQVCVGLAYLSQVSPMPIEFEMQNGVTLLRKKIIGELRMRVYDSVGGACRAGAGEFQPVISRDVLFDRMNRAVSRKTEAVTLQTHSGYDKSITVTVKQDRPLPFNLAVLSAVCEVTE